MTKKTFGVSFENEERYNIFNQRFQNFKDNMKGRPKNSLVLETIFDLAEDINLKERFVHTSQEAQDIIKAIQCEFLIYDGLFFCTELVHKTKSRKQLGSTKDEAHNLCKACQLGKALQIVKEYQKKLRGKNIKGLLQMITTFETFHKEGVPSPLYFCNRIPEDQIFTGMKTIYCSSIKKDISIHPTCSDPRCRYFEDYTIHCEQGFPEQTLQLIEGIAEDFKRIEDLTTKKTIEVEQVEPDV